LVLCRLLFRSGAACFFFFFKLMEPRGMVRRLSRGEAYSHYSSIDRPEVRDANGR